MDTETELRQRARELIQQGQLPSARPTTAWGGYGLNELCMLCAQAIRADQLQYEIVAAVGKRKRLFAFHDVCHAVWLLERAGV